MDTHFTGDDKNDNIVDVEYTKLMGHLDLSKFIEHFTVHFRNFSLVKLTISPFICSGIKNIQKLRLFRRQKNPFEMALLTRNLLLDQK